MEAMILAAGLGTRLRPLTDHTPKALVKVGEMPMLEHVARRLIAAGATRLIINVHAHADQIHDFVDRKDGFGVDVRVSYEPEQRLETGGGLLHAAPHFEKAAPFIMHNADIFTDLDLQALYAAHQHYKPLATLAVRPPETNRYLLFDVTGNLCGYASDGEEHLITEPKGEPERLDFCGVQVLSPRIFDLITERGVFSIINVYLRLVKVDERVTFFRTGDSRWIDVGTRERLEEARKVFGSE